MSRGNGPQHDFHAFLDAFPDAPPAPDVPPAPDAAPAAAPDAAKPAAGDPFQRLTTPDSDRSSHAEFRREIEAIAREIMGDAAGTEPPDGPGANGPGNATGEREGLDIRDGTPFRVLMLARAMASAVGRKDDRDPGAVVRDLVLLEIARRPGTSSLHLRGRFRLPASTTSELVARLVEEGLVARRPSHSDRRIRVLTLTRAGTTAATETARRWRQADEDLLTTLSPGQRDTLRRLARLAGRSLA